MATAASNFELNALSLDSVSNARQIIGWLPDCLCHEGRAGITTISRAPDAQSA